MGALQCERLGAAKYQREIDGLGTGISAGVIEGTF